MIRMEVHEASSQRQVHHLSLAFPCVEPSFERQTLSPRRGGLRGKHIITEKGGNVGISAFKLSPLVLFQDSEAEQPTAEHEEDENEEKERHVEHLDGFLQLVRLAHVQNRYFRQDIEFCDDEKDQSDESERREFGKDRVDEGHVHVVRRFFQDFRHYFEQDGDDDEDRNRHDSNVRVVLVLFFFVFVVFFFMRKRRFF